LDLQLTGNAALLAGPAKGTAITTGFAREGCDLVLVERYTASIEPVAEVARASGRICRRMGDTVRLGSIQYPEML
jgi:hypothetical protein